MRKVNGFTLIELTVAMFISSIVVLVAFTCYEISFKQYLNYKQSGNKIAAAMQLNTLITRDFLNNDKVIVGQDNGIVLLKDTAVKVAYRFSSAYILRIVPGVSPDTFFIAASNMQQYFGHNIITEGQGIIDELSFQSKINGEGIPFHFSKEYAADVLMVEETNTKSIQ